MWVAVAVVIAVVLLFLPLRYRDLMILDKEKKMYIATEYISIGYFVKMAHKRIFKTN